MFERYNEAARRALFYARLQMSRFGGPSVAIEHLLLGLIHQNNTPSCKLLARAGLRAEDVRADVEHQAPRGERVPTSREIPFSHEVARALERAAEEADRAYSTEIGSEHLLLAILREESSLAASILQARGLTFDRARALSEGAADQTDQT